MYSIQRSIINILNSNIKSMKKISRDNSRLIRPNSVSHFRTSIQPSIVFNPRQSQVGESNISKLAQKPLTRRNSQPTLPRTERFQKTQKQDQQLQLSIMKSVNMNLKKENQQLKRQLENYRRLTKVKVMENTLTSRQLKNMVMEKEKINRTKCSSRLVTDSCFTGMYSSKQNSYEQFKSIKQTHQNYFKKGVQITFQQYQQQQKKFFVELQNTCIQLKGLFDVISNKDIFMKRFRSQYLQTEQLLKNIQQVCHIKIQHEKVAEGRYPADMIKGKSKPKVQRGPTREKYQPQKQLSQRQIVDRLEQYIQSVLESPKILKELKSSFILRQLKNRLWKQDKTTV